MKVKKNILNIENLSSIKIKKSMISKYRNMRPLATDNIISFYKLVYKSQMMLIWLIANMVLFHKIVFGLLSILIWVARRGLKR